MAPKRRLRQAEGFVAPLKQGFEEGKAGCPASLKKTGGVAGGSIGFAGPL